MPNRLPSDVARFLRDNPEELQRVKHRMVDVEELRTRPTRQAAEKERRAKLPLKPCSGNGYACGVMTPGGFPCPSCVQDYKDDPDAYK